MSMFSRKWLQKATYTANEINGHQENKLRFILIILKKTF